MVIDAGVFYELLVLLVNLNSEKAKILADSLFELYNDNLANLSSSDVNYCNLYISLCKDVISQQLNISDNRADILNLINRYLNNQLFKKDKFIQGALREMINSKTTPQRLADISKKLNNLVMWYKSKTYITKIYGQLQECKLAYAIDDQSEKIDSMKTLVDEFKNKILEIDSVVGKNGPVEVIDFSKRDTIHEAYGLFQSRQVTHVLKTGLQGLNKMCGPRGGFALGESIIFCSLTHNFKSGMLLNMARWIADYSTPPKCGHKKPMILMITLENIGYMNMMTMFTQMYVTINGVPPAPEMTQDQLVDAIYEYFNRGEYTLVIERYLPGVFGYEEFVKLLEKYENSGFTVVATLIDYVAKMKLINGVGSSKVGDHLALQELYSKVCNYCKAVGTTMFSGAQLNRGASDIVGSGIRHPVKNFSERHLAGSIGIGHEVDMIVYQNIEHDEQGNSWLTMQWGKHRYVENTPDVDRFVAYKFNEFGIADDVAGTFEGKRNIYIKSEDKASQQDIESILGITN